MDYTVTSHLDFYFFVLGGIQVLGIILFLVILKVVNFGSGNLNQSKLEQNKYSTITAPERSIRRRNIPNYNRASISDRPMTPNYVTEGSGMSSTGSNGQEKLISVAGPPPVRRTVGRDRSLRIGAGINDVPE